MDPEPSTPPAVLLGGARDEDATTPSDRNRRRRGPRAGFDGSPPPFAARAFRFRRRDARAGVPAATPGLASVSIRAPGEGDADRRGHPRVRRRRPERRFLTEVEFHELGRETTDRGLDELCGTPEFAKWMRRRAHKVRLEREDDDDDDP